MHPIDPPAEPCVEADSTDDLVSVTKKAEGHTETIKSFLKGYNLK